MSRLPEQRLWDRMRNNVANAARIKLERIENMVSDGFPDVWAICKSVVTPVELKAVEEPPVRVTTRLLPVGKGLSVEQRNWHKDWAKHGGQSLIVVGVGKGNSARHYMATGSRADEVNDWSEADWAARGIYFADSPHRALGPQFWPALIKVLERRA